MQPIFLKALLVCKIEAVLMLLSDFDPKVYIFLCFHWTCHRVSLDNNTFHNWPFFCSRSTVALKVWCDLQCKTRIRNELASSCFYLEKKSLVFRNITNKWHFQKLSDGMDAKVTLKVSKVQASKSHSKFFPKGFKGKICVPAENLDKTLHIL